MPVTDWRIDRNASAAGLVARVRLRAPYRVLKAIFSDEGDTEEDDGGKVSTGWVLKKKAGALLVFVHDKQDDENRKFNLENFRARPHFDWHVSAKEEGTLKDFCLWLSKEVIRRVEAEPQPKRLTASAKEKVNDAIAKGMSVQDAMKAHAEWELIAPAAEAYKWPVKDPSPSREAPPPKDPKTLPAKGAKGKAAKDAKDAKNAKDAKDAKGDEVKGEEPEDLEEAEDGEDDDEDEIEGAEETEVP